MSQIDTYNGQPIIKNIIIDIASMDNLEAKTITAETLKIDTDNTREQIKTQTLTLDNNDIEELIKSNNVSYTSDNKKICSKGYIDEAINNIPSTDLSECVKNNIDQTLTNKFIMTNTSNEININKLKIKDYDNNNIDTIEKIKTGGSNDNDTLTTKGYVDNGLNNKLNSSDAVGQNYLLSGVIKGEIFNDYTNNKASGSVSHAEGYNTTATGYASHAEGNSTIASDYGAHAEGYFTKARGAYGSHAEGYYSEALGYYGSHASGYNTCADKASMFVCGKYNIYDTSQPTLNNNKLFVVGNGAVASARSDALVVKSTGEVIINSTATNTTPSLVIGTSKGITGTTATSSSTNTGDDIITTKYYVDENCITKSNILFTNCTIRIRYLTTSYNVWMPKDISTFGIFFFKSQTEVYFTGDLYIDTLPDINTTNPEVYIEYIQYKISETFCVPESGTPHNQVSLLYAITPSETLTVAICYLKVERNPIASHPWNLYLINYVDKDGEAEKIGYITTSSNILIKLNYVYFVKLE